MIEMTSKTLLSVFDKGVLLYMEYDNLFFWNGYRTLLNLSIRKLYNLQGWQGVAK